MKSLKSILTRQQVRDRDIQETWDGLSLWESKNNNNIKKHETKKTEATEPLGEETRPVLTRRQMRDKEMLEAWGDLGLGDSNLYQTVNKNKRKPETEKETATPLLTRRQARDREMQETWGGLDLGNSIRPSKSKLERDKAARIKAEKEEMSRGN